MPKKTTKERCKNCGDWTHFGNATADRERRGWCGPCMTQFQKYARVNSRGEVWWRDPQNLGARKPFDSPIEPKPPMGC